MSGSLVSYLLVLLADYVPAVQNSLFNVCILSGCTGYISQLLGFILFRVRYPCQERKYVSPLGIGGAVFPLLVFLFVSMSVIGFQDDSCFAFILYLGVIGVCTLWYFCYSKKRQFFSTEEQFIFAQQIVKCKPQLSVIFNEYFPIFLFVFCVTFSSCARFNLAAFFVESPPFSFYYTRDIFLILLLFF